jgi:hypothetical protein
MKYESPRLISLGVNESAAGEQLECKSGTKASWTPPCATGSGDNQDVCETGVQASEGNCRPGGTARDCLSGSNAL